MMTGSDFHDGRSRFHLFVAGANQGNKGTSSVQNFIFLFLC